jgi:hypothetical protein
MCFPLLLSFGGVVVVTLSLSLPPNSQIILSSFFIITAFAFHLSPAFSLYTV